MLTKKINCNAVVAKLLIVIFRSNLRVTTTIMRSLSYDREFLSAFTPQSVTSKFNYAVKCIAIIIVLRLP